jgi:hypothetical protein
MLISRAIHIENENVNLEKGARKQPQPSRPAYEHPSALWLISPQRLVCSECLVFEKSYPMTNNNYLRHSARKREKSCWLEFSSPVGQRLPNI